MSLPTSTPTRAAARHPRLGLFGLALLLSPLGCAGPRATQRETSPAPTATVAPAREATPSAPGSTKPTDAQSSSTQLRLGSDGTPLPTAALTAKLTAARVVYVGEHHNSPASHRVQLAVLSALQAIDRDLALGIEMLPVHMQPQLDAFVSGALDEDGFLAAVDWKHTWGFDYGLYRPLFDFCRGNGLRIYALNAPKELSRLVRQRGFAGLGDAERRILPSGFPYPEPEAHQKLLRGIFDQHPAAPGSDPKDRDAAFQRFYSAQLVWDESMAESVARVLSSPTAPHRLLVLAGTGHVGPYAVPGRARRRGIDPSLTIGPIEPGDEKPPGGAEATDLLYVLDDPPAR